MRCSRPVARPGGLEPPTHSLEELWLCNEINGVVADKAHRVARGRMEYDQSATTCDQRRDRQPRRCKSWATVSAPSYPTRNIGRLEEHADDNRNCWIVSD